MISKNDANHSGLRSSKKWIFFRKSTVSDVILIPREPAAAAAAVTPKTARRASQVYGRQNTNNAECCRVAEKVSVLLPISFITVGELRIERPFPRPIFYENFYARDRLRHAYYVLGMFSLYVPT